MITKETYTLEYVNTLREKYKKLSYMRNQSAEAFAYIVESLRIIEE